MAWALGPWKWYCATAPPDFRANASFKAIASPDFRTNVSFKAIASPDFRTNVHSKPSSRRISAPTAHRHPSLGQRPRKKRPVLAKGLKARSISRADEAGLQPSKVLANHEPRPMA